MGGLLGDNYVLRSCKEDRIGCIKLSYKQSDATSVSVIAHLASAGLTQPHEFEGSWGCSTSKWSTMKPKPLSKDDMLAELKDENNAQMWVLRFVGLIMAWLSLWCCLQPIAAAA